SLRSAATAPGAEDRLRPDQYGGVAREKLEAQKMLTPFYRADSRGATSGSHEGRFRRSKEENRRAFRAGADRPEKPTHLSRPARLRGKETWIAVVPLEFVWLAICRGAARAR